MTNWLPFSNEHRDFYYPIIIVVLVGAIWCGVNYILDGHAVTVCLSKLLFGVPCPGCGMTRACVSLARADIAQAVYYNVNSLVVAPALVVLMGLVAYDIACNRATAHALVKRVNNLRVSWWLVAAILVIQVFVELHHLRCGI